MKAIITSILVTTIFLFSGSAFAKKNVALKFNGGIATASSYGCYDGCRYASYANDGNADTYWCGTEYSSGWIQIEFNDAYTINQICLNVYYHTLTYEVLLSIDGANWTTVVSSTTSNNESSEDTVMTHNISATEAKFLKVRILNSNSPSSHIFKTCLYEIEAWSLDGDETDCILTQDNPDVTVLSGESVTIYGTTDPNYVTVESGANVKLMNFPGNNTVSIVSSSGGFSVSRSGATVIFQGSDGTLLRIPATQTDQIIEFFDRSPLTLRINNGQVMLDDQVVTTTAGAINGSSEVVGECGAYVAPGVWKEFDCYNLAAIGKTTGDDPFTPSWRLIGGAWQWGRKGPDSSQWHNTNTSNFAHGPTGPTEDDINSDAISGWSTSYAPDGAWSDSSKTANDPCPTGYRLPTQIQWDGINENNTQSIVGTWSDDATNYSSGRFFGDYLMLPASGYRYYKGGSLQGHDFSGFYWSSTEDSSDSNYAWNLFFCDVSIGMTSNYRMNGFSVRCVAKDEESETVVVIDDETSASEINEVYIDESDKVNITTTENCSLGDNLTVDSIITVSPDTDDRFPFGLTGKISSITNNADGSVTATIEDTTLAEVVDSSVQDVYSALDADNFLGAISPSATQASASALAAYKNKSITTASNTKTKYAVNGGVIVRNANNALKSSKNVTVEDTIQLGDGGSVDLNLTVPLADMGIDVNDFDSDAAFIIDGSLENLKLEYVVDFDKFSGLNELKAVVSGDLNIDVKLNGNGSTSFGYYSSAWDEVEDAQAKILGFSGTLTGLDGKDKVGKFPLVGLIWSAPCASIGICQSTFGDSETPISLANTGGVIVWVYIDAQGTISLDGEIGARVNSAKFSVGLEKPVDGELTSVREFDNYGDERLIELPYLDGNVGLDARVGVAVDVDAFFLGVRLVNASVEFAGDFSTDIEGEQLSYGTYSLDEDETDWTWEGSVCMTTNYGVGMIFSASVHAGVDIDSPVFDFDADYSYYGQWPSEDEIEIPGWHGMGDLNWWYTAEGISECFNSGGGDDTNCGAYIAPGVWKEFDCYNLAAIGKTTDDDPFTPSWRLIGGYWQWGGKGPDESQWYDTNTSNFAHGPTGPDEADANVTSQ